jgi:hypothetical protein
MARLLTIGGKGEKGEDRMKTWERKEKADGSSEMGPAIAMNLLFLISLSNVTLSLMVVYAPALLLLLLPVTMALLAPAMAKSEAEIWWFSFW